MATVRSVLVLIAAMLFTAVAARAAVPLENAINEAPPNSPSGLPRPDNGMTMNQVEKQFGPPTKKMAAVGTPPITRWVYPNYTVYFEKNLVIYSVVHRDALK